jgi:hypothetical protein
MPIGCEAHESCDYFISHWEGVVTDSELIPGYSAFVEGDEWIHGMHELTDVTGADLSRITREGLVSLANWASNFYERRGVQFVKTAVLTRSDDWASAPIIYEVWSPQSPEHLRIFKQRDEAVRWLGERAGTGQVGPGDVAGGGRA